MKQKIIGIILLIVSLCCLAYSGIELYKYYTENNNNEQIVEELKTEVVNNPVYIENNEVIGKISGFNKLYVRKEANIDSEPVGIVTKDDDLSIDIIHSTDDFYKVYTSNGLEGYCVKNFVKVD